MRGNLNSGTFFFDFSETGDETKLVNDLQISDLKPGKPHWANYVKGVLANFHAKEGLEKGLDLAIVTSVPLGKKLLFFNKFSKC